MSIPTIAFFQPGKQPMGVVGFRPAEQLEQQFGARELPEDRRRGRRRRQKRTAPQRVTPRRGDIVRRTTKG